MEQSLIRIAPFLLTVKFEFSLSSNIPIIPQNVSYFHQHFLHLYITLLYQIPEEYPSTVPSATSGSFSAPSDNPSSYQE